jgi:hypothetical protein
MHSIAILAGALAAVAPAMARPHGARHAHLVENELNKRGNISTTSKRGVAYNDANLALPFVGAPAVSWAYNWGQYSDELDSSLQYIPTLWGTASDFTSGWADGVATALGAGASYVFSFNEPDHPEQSNLSPTDAASGYQTYIQPLAGQAMLGAPSVTNGAAPMGLDWLNNFITACSGCQIDFVNLHWYDSAFNAQYFKDHLTEANTNTGKPVFVTEFGCVDGSDDDISAFLTDVMGWMDEQDWVLGYSYFMAEEGRLISGGALSTYGHTFAGI